MGNFKRLIKESFSSRYNNSTRESKDIYSHLLNYTDRNSFRNDVISFINGNIDYIQIYIIRDLNFYNINDEIIINLLSPNSNQSGVYTSKNFYNDIKINMISLVGVLPDKNELVSMNIDSVEKYIKYKLSSHNTLATFVHEYTHYKQDIDNILFTDKKDRLLNVISDHSSYFNSPAEVDAFSTSMIDFLHSTKFKHLNINELSRIINKDLVWGNWNNSNKKRFLKRLYLSFKYK